MRRRSDRYIGIVLGLLLGIAIVAIFVFGFSGETVDAPSLESGDRQAQEDAAPEVPEITLASGQPEGGVEEIEVKSGGTIAFEVTSDVDDEVHVHGYDITKPLPAGKTVSFEVPADIEGVFEVESHDFGTPIAEVSVVP